MTGGGVIDGGNVSWTSGNVTWTAGTGIFTTFTLAGGSQTFDIDGGGLEVATPTAALTWSSGTVELTDGGSLTNDDVGGTITIPTGDTATLDAEDGTVTGTVTNDGTLHWANDDLPYLSSIDNSGTVVFDADVDLSGVTLSGGTYDVTDSTEDDGGVTIDSGATLTLSDGTVTLYDFGNTAGTLDLAGASVTIDGSSYGTINWTAGTLDVDSEGFTNYGTLALEGGSNTLTLTGEGIISGHLTWTSGNVDCAGFIADLDECTLEGGDQTLTLNGGSLDVGGDGTDLAWDSGTIELTDSGKIDVEEYCSMTVSSGDTVTLDDESGTIEGTIANEGTLTISGSAAFSEATLLNEGGTVTITGSPTFTGSTLLNDGGTINIETGSDTLTLDDSTLENGDADYAALNWENGTIALTDGGEITNDDGDGATFTVGSDDEVSLDADGGTVSGTITNEGVLRWTGTSVTALSNIDNTGTVVFDADVDLSGLTLTGGSYQVGGGYTADVTTTLTVNSAALTVDADGMTEATLDWSGGNISIGTDGTVVNDGTLTISTTGNFTGTVGVGGFTDNSSLGSEVTATTKTLADAATAPTFTGDGPPYDWSDTSSVQIFNSAGTARNTGWWGSTDVTAIPESTGSPNLNGVLVTPQDMILAGHYSPANDESIVVDGIVLGGAVDNWPVTFLGADGTVYNRYIVEECWVYGTDIQVCTLNCPLPTTGAGAVTPMKLLPADFNDYFLNSSQYPPVAFTNQDKTLLIGQYDGTGTVYYYDVEEYFPNEVHIIEPTNATLQEFFYPVRGGDSGSPIMMLINGEATLVADLHGSNGTNSFGPSDALYLTDINTAIANDAAALEITADTVSTVDLSGYTDYSALL